MISCWLRLIEGDRKVEETCDNCEKINHRVFSRIERIIMDIQEFRVRGKEMVEYICEFMSNIHNRRVTPDVGPGYLRPLLPSEAPQQPEPWENIMRDVESKIMPGVSEKEKLSFLSLIFLLNDQEKGNKV